MAGCHFSAIGSAIEMRQWPSRHQADMLIKQLEARTMQKSQSNELAKTTSETPFTWWLFLAGGGVLSLIHQKVLVTPGFSLAFGVMAALLAVLRLTSASARV